MTTIDPHDFSQENLKVDLVIPGTIIKDFRDFNEPQVKVWDNVTFADNYYQTIANPNGFTWTPNGRFIDGADINILLNGRTGFTKDDRKGSPHGNVFSWYTGTADLAIDEVDNGYTQEARPVYDQLGERSLEKLLNFQDNNVVTLTPWYSSNGNQSSTEGIGTGWYYSVLGGGKRPTVDMNKRVSVDFDNTDEDIVSGDFAVPTVFNGSFDVGLSDDPNAPVAGWSFHNGDKPLLRKNLVNIKTITTIENTELLEIAEDETQELTDPLSAALSVDEVQNYSALLQGNVKKITHDGIEVPDWGDLRFDIHAPQKSGKLKISLSATKVTRDVNGRILLEPLNFSKEIDLSKNATGTLKEYENDIYKIGRGRNGFETFHIDSKDLEIFRGLKTKIGFEIQGDTKVFIDNVFFKSVHLQFGNPTEARYTSKTPGTNNPYSTNLLLEKPQFAVSYDSSINTPAWVSWQLNQNWRGNTKRPTETIFLGDPELPDGWKKIDTSYYQDSNNKSYGFDQGHVIPSGDRTNSTKDNIATFLGTNLIPQSVDNNQFFSISYDPTKASAWSNIERFERELVKQGKELYIVAGVYGGNSKPQKRSNALETRFSGDTDSAAFANNGINIPKWTWKTILVLDKPGQGLEDVNENTITYTFLTPNRAEPYANWATNGQAAEHPFNEIQDQLGLSDPLSDIQNATEWRNPSTWQITIDQLENLLNGWGGRKYNFLSNVSDDIQNQIEDKIYYPSLPISAALLANTQILSNSIAQTRWINNELSIWHGSATEESTPIQTLFVNDSPSEIGSSEINPLHLSIKQVSSTQIGITEVSTSQNSTVQISSTQISTPKFNTSQGTLFQVGSTQVSTGQVGRIFELLENLMMGQNNSTQILTPQISAMQNYTRKPSLSGDVTSEEFLGTNYTGGVAFNTAIGHNSLTKQGIFYFSPSQISPIQISLNQNSLSQNSPSQISPSQISPSQISPSQISPSQVGMSQISIVQPSNPQISSNQVGSTQIGIVQVATKQSNRIQISPAQVDLNKVSIIQGNSPTQINPAKIPLPSSVLFQQFFNIHNLPLASTNTYKDNLLNLWNTLFDPTNPFNVTFSLTNLPTGQLAEAQITQFDQYGRPNGGTILIDNDANGVGWFIDPTPLDNSEYTTTLTDTAYRATTGNAAGKYDLLTTILHETGHLLGIISGNSGFDKYIQTINNTKHFITDNITATLTPDGSHLDSKVHPYDLMNNTLAPGVRKLPSWLNLQMLNAIRNTTVASNSATQLTAPLTAILPYQ